MDTVTYPDAGTVDLINDNLIAIRVHVASESALANRFTIRYTPTIVTLDEDGVEQQRTVGFLPPSEFIPALLLGIGKSHYAHNRFTMSSRVLSRLMANYPQSQWAREAENLKRASDKRSS
jgi:thioredoxin-related protein